PSKESNRSPAEFAMDEPGLVLKHYTQEARRLEGVGAAWYLPAHTRAGPGPEERTWRKSPRKRSRSPIAEDRPGKRPTRPKSRNVVQRLLGALPSRVVPRFLRPPRSRVAQRLVRPPSSPTRRLRPRPGSSIFRGFS